MDRKYKYEFVVDEKNKVISFGDFSQSTYYLIKSPKDSLSAISVYGFVIWFWLINLPPEQRYGIDEYGNAKTPEYMQKKIEQEKY